MSQVSVTKKVNAPAERVWEIISDFGNPQVYHPLVKDADLLSVKDRGLGAKRRCNLYNSTSAVEEITRWVEGREFTAAATEGPMPFNNVEAGMRVIPLGTSSSEVTIAMSYVPKWGLAGRLLNALMMRMAVRKMLTKVLTGLEHHVTTGELVGKNGVPEGQAPEKAQLANGVRIAS